VLTQQKLKFGIDLPQKKLVGSLDSPYTYVFLLTILKNYIIFNLGKEQTMHFEKIPRL
jgi:hypothetical protein